MLGNRLIFLKYTICTAIPAAVDASLFGGQRGCPRRAIRSWRGDFAAAQA